MAGDFVGMEVGGRQANLSPPGLRGLRRLSTEGVWGRDEIRRSQLPPGFSREVWRLARGLYYSLVLSSSRAFATQLSGPLTSPPHGAET